MFEYGKMSVVYCLVDPQTHSLSSVFHTPSLQITSPVSFDMCHYYCNFTLIHMIMQLQTVFPSGL